MQKFYFIDFEDIWDDSVLIKSYDKAINIAKEEVCKRIGLDNQDSGSKQKKPQSQKLARQAQKAQKTQKVSITTDK